MRTIYYIKKYKLFTSQNLLVCCSNCICMCTCVHVCMLCPSVHFSVCMRQSLCLTHGVDYQWRQRFVVLQHSFLGAIVETISQLFSSACDRLVCLMWEPSTSPSSRPPTPPPHTASGWLLSQQEEKVSASVVLQRENERELGRNESIEFRG